ncbi:UNVERIFIED_CONTAM: hypothetical protein K2H54_050107 [Gekko kuhli]
MEIWFQESTETTAVGIDYGIHKRERRFQRLGTIPDGLDRSSVGGNSESECRYRGSSIVRSSESEGRAGAEVESEGQTGAEETVVGAGVDFLGRFGSGGPEGASGVTLVLFPGFLFSLVGWVVDLGAPAIPARLLSSVAKRQPLVIARLAHFLAG